MASENTADQNIQQARETYGMDVWSDGFFHIDDKGHVTVRPTENPDLSIDINEVVDAALEGGSSLPLIVRFQDIIAARVQRLNRKFREAIAEAEYPNKYRSIYPIKVNQLHEVVAEVQEAGREFDAGLECGSKAELMAALPLIGDDTLLLCNGVKDHVMLSLMLNAQQLGQQVIPIIEKYSEFEQLLLLAAEQEQTPRLGVRVKLNTKGSGRWYESGGSRSKFGLTIPEVVKLVQTLKARGQSDSLELLHFHLGSQISDIQVLRSAVKEITQIYADLIKRGCQIKFLDVGGGLGVNYGGDYDNAESSINYGLREYANVIVYAVKEICEARDVPVPTLLSESGRALTAHHSMLVVPVLGVHRPDSPPLTDELDEDEIPGVLSRMQSTLADAEKNTVPGILLECYHDAEELRTEVDQLLRLGYISLEHVAQSDRLYWHTCREVLRKLQEAELSPPPQEQLDLEVQLTDLYLCDFSVFHSIIDHWAIDQIFPVMPLHRLDEMPTRRAQVVDLTCDSDGKIKNYVCGQGNANWLPLHEHQAGERYHLGIFLVGAYQEILGDAHNLMGRVDEVHVYARDDEPGNFWIEESLKGLSTQEMLSQVQYFPNDLDRRLNEFIRKQINAGVIKPNAANRILNNYSKRLNESTYCSTDIVRSES